MKEDKLITVKISHIIPVGIDRNGGMVLTVARCGRVSLS